MKVKKAKATPTEEKTKQLDLGIKEPFKNKLFKVKSKTDAAILQLEVRKFLKDPFFWFVMTFGFAMLAQQIWIIYQSFEKLPSLIPIFNYYLITLDSLASKLYIASLPIISLVALIGCIILTTKYYNREKMLIKFVLLATLLTSIAETIILIHLISGY